MVNWEATDVISTDCEYSSEFSATVVTYTVDACAEKILVCFECLAPWLQPDFFLFLLPHGYATLGFGLSVLIFCGGYFAPFPQPFEKGLICVVAHPFC